MNIRAEISVIKVTEWQIETNSLTNNFPFAEYLRWWWSNLDGTETKNKQAICIRKARSRMLKIVEILLSANDFTHPAVLPSRSTLH